MRKHLNSKQDRNFVPATYRGPMPGDFPIGSLESRVAMRAILDAYTQEQRNQEEALLAEFTPAERAHIQSLTDFVDEPPIRIWILRLFRVALERAIVYEQPLPLDTPEEIRNRRAVFKEIGLDDRRANRNYAKSSSIEWNRLRAVAEENLRPKKK